MEQNTRFLYRLTMPHKAVFPNLFNYAGGIIKPAAVDVNNVEQELELLTVLSQVRTIDRSALAQQEQQVAEAIVIEENEAINLEQDQLKQEVEAYFCEVIESGQNLSALDYYNHKQLAFRSRSLDLSSHRGVPRFTQ